MGEGTPENLDFAMELFERACKGGSGYGCTRAGDLFVGAEKPAPAAARYEQSCELEYTLGCIYFGMMLHYGRGVSVDVAHARVLYADACSDGEGYGCYWLGRVHLAGEVPGGTEATARTLFERGCTLKDSESCHEFALMLLQGVGGPPDAKRARRLLRESCDHGFAPACESIGSASPEPNDDGPPVLYTDGPSARLSRPAPGLF